MGNKIDKNQLAVWMYGPIAFRKKVDCFIATILSDINLTDDLSEEDAKMLLRFFFGSEYRLLQTYSTVERRTPTQIRKFYCSFIGATKKLISIMEAIKSDEGLGFIMSMGNPDESPLARSKPMANNRKHFLETLESLKEWVGFTEYLLNEHRRRKNPGRDAEYIRRAVSNISFIYKKMTGKKFGRTTYKGVDRGELFARDVFAVLEYNVKPSTIRAAVDFVVAEDRKKKKT